MDAIKKILIGLAIFFVSVLCVANTVAAAGISKNDSTVITISVVAAIIALVFTFFFLTGGIKYVTPENVLDTEIRKNLYTYLDECPGSHLREIAREMNLKPSNAAWHLRKLEQTNLVRSRLIGGKKVFYLVEGGIEARKLAIAESILRNENACNIMQYLNDHPGKHLLEIAHALNLNHHVVKWHLKKMHEAELIDGDTSHSVYPVYSPTQVGVEALESYSSFTHRTVKVEAV